MCLRCYMFSALALSLCLAAALASPSIEHEPVRVTHRNSGPKYDFEDQREQEQPSVIHVPTRNDNSNNNGDAPKPEEGESQNDTPSMPMFTIRRIFLTPVRPITDQDEDSSPTVMNRPTAMFLPPFLGMPRPHDFLGDSSMPSSHRLPANDRQEDRPELMEAPVDPMQNMLDLLRHVLTMSRPPMSQFGDDSNSNRDLNKEATGGSQDKSTSDGEPISSERPSMPKSFNETQEDVVEIEGKKYLRKVVVNRHVGENIVFVTRRLIFTPLNETDSETNPTTTSTTQPSAGDSRVDSTESSSTEASPSSTEAATGASSTEEPKSSTTTTSTAASTEAVSSSELPSSSVSGSAVEREEMATTVKPWLNRVQDAIEKVADRLEDSRTSTTTAPEATSSAATEKSTR